MQFGILLKSAQTFSFIYDILYVVSSNWSYTSSICNLNLFPSLEITLAFSIIRLLLLTTSSSLIVADVPAKQVDSHQKKIAEILVKSSPICFLFLSQSLARFQQTSIWDFKLTKIVCQTCYIV